MAGNANITGVEFSPGKETYGKLVRELSEPESGPHADNLMTNEDSFPRVCGEIAARVPETGVYIGVGPDQNFSYIAHARPGLAFIVDFRRRNLLLHMLHKALFALCEDRVAYVSSLTARRPQGIRPEREVTAAELVDGFANVPMERALLEETVMAVARHLAPLEVVADHEWAELATMQARLAGPGMEARFLALPMYPTFGQLIRTTDREGQPAHMLAREETFVRVRDAQRANRVVPVVGDFAGEHALPRLAHWLREHGQRVAMVYVSDVEFFLLRSGRFGDYIKNLGRLPWADGALLVRTSTRPIEHPDRVAGDQSTTIVRPLEVFLAAARAGTIRTPDDLFGT